GTLACPAPPATITGTILAGDVTNLANAQGLSSGELDELVAAMRAGFTYVNVHSTVWPGGEVRAQIDSLCSVAVGDVNGDHAVDVLDIFYLINFLFAGGAAPSTIC